MDDGGWKGEPLAPDQLAGSNYDMFEAPSSKKLKPVGEWNEARIVYNNGHVEHWLNGTKVLEYELSSEPVLTAVQKSKFREVQGFGEKQNGHILLTYHNDPVSYRNIKIRPLSGKTLPPPANFRVVQ